MCKLHKFAGGFIRGAESAMGVIIRRRVGYSGRKGGAVRPGAHELVCVKSSFQLTKEGVMQLT